MSEPGTVIACFGEILWDSLPGGLFLGGAPLNVAYHLLRQGVRALPVSAVGRDLLGDEACRRMAAWGLETRWIGRQGGFPTGMARVTLAPAGAPHFHVARAAAWDHIPITRPLRYQRTPPTALVFGTLALRGTANRRTLARLFSTWPDAWRVADLNLRPPFDHPGVIASVLREAQLVKLNSDELRRLTGASARRPDALERTIRRFSRRHGIPRVCVTAGACGAGLLWDGGWSWEEARPIEICDTVGAGDAFLAGLLAALLLHRCTPAEALAHACRLGEFVAARDGATPPYQCGARGQTRVSSP